jgi:hypothetical protein
MGVDAGLMQVLMQVLMQMQIKPFWLCYERAKSLVFTSKPRKSGEPASSAIAG